MTIRLQTYSISVTNQTITVAGSTFKVQMDAGLKPATAEQLQTIAKGFSTIENPEYIKLLLTGSPGITQANRVFSEKPLTIQITTSAKLNLTNQQNDADPFQTQGYYEISANQMVLPENMTVGTVIHELNHAIHDMLFLRADEYGDEFAASLDLPESEPFTSLVVPALPVIEACEIDELDYFLDLSGKKVLNDGQLEQLQRLRGEIQERGMAFPHACQNETERAAYTQAFTDDVPFENFVALCERDLQDKAATPTSLVKTANDLLGAVFQNFKTSRDHALAVLQQNFLLNAKVAIDAKKKILGQFFGNLYGAPFPFEKEILQFAEALIGDVKLDPVVRGEAFGLYRAYNCAKIDFANEDDKNARLAKFRTLAETAIFARADSPASLLAEVTETLNMTIFSVPSRNGGESKFGVFEMADQERNTEFLFSMVNKASVPLANRHAVVMALFKTSGGGEAFYAGMTDYLSPELFANATVPIEYKHQYVDLLIKFQADKNTADDGMQRWAADRLFYLANATNLPDEIVAKVQKYAEL